MGHDPSRGWIDRIVRGRRLHAPRPRRRQDHRLVSPVLDGPQRLWCSAAERHRTLPRRRDDQGRYPREFDRGGVLPGLSRRKTMDGSPAQARWLGVRAISGNGSGIAIGYGGQLERPVGGPHPGPAGGRDHRGAGRRQRRMRVAFGLRVERLRNWDHGCTKLSTRQPDSPFCRAK